MIDIKLNLPNLFLTLATLLIPTGSKQACLVIFLTFFYIVLYDFILCIFFDLLLREIDCRDTVKIFLTYCSK